ncbi:protein trichome birefringence-like 40 [Elaeis guineensis]|uniref:Protein trichome birefringence-like 40 n=1 Tax=Elaeis guineensis var. tenera TaxID=51953 RepID=A0A6I9QWV8_ELAGV|nr:protein trichome birefringence-like 40 [Elaeis guineensis]
MEFPTANVAKRILFLCTLASFLGGFLLYSSLSQGHWPGLAFASLGSLEATMSMESPMEYSSTPLPSPPNMEGRARESYNLDLPSPSSFPAPTLAERWSPAEFSIESSPQSLRVEMVQPPQSTIAFSPQPSVVEETLRRSNDKFLSPQLVSVAQPVFMESSQHLATSEANSEVSSRSTERTSLSLDGKSIERKCNIFDGRWVYDPKAYPLYHGKRCPFLGAQVSCQKNGRPDSAYEHWRWEPNGCRIPRFNGSYVLERLRGKRVAIIGDSLNRNQWESLACLLYSSVRPSRAFIKSQSSDYKIFRAVDYDCSVEFYWSPFLVELKEREDQSKVLRLGKLPGSAKSWRGADVMVFNTGHWWTHRGKMRPWNYYEHGGDQLVEDMERDKAFEMGLRTWARWVDRNVDPSKTTVFFRSISPEHKRENLHWCYNQTHPITNETYVQWFPRSMIATVEKTLTKMRTPVRYLNITRLSEYRRDAHAAVYTMRRGKLLTPEQRDQPQTYADCSHWCLPGLPDTWNVLLLASIVGSPSTVM